MKRAKTIQYTPSDKARTVINNLRLSGESDQGCIDRLIGNLIVIAYGRDNYEEHFGPQQRAPVKRAITADRCEQCGRPFTRSNVGRPRKYCMVCVEQLRHRTPGTQARKKRAEKSTDVSTR